MVTVKEVKTRKDLRIFAGFNEKMYRDDPNAVPDMISDEMENFTPSKNPAFEYCRSKQFLAYKDGECVGRIGAIISDKANEKWNRKRIRFTRVDFIDDYEVSAALFKAVEDWGREEGLTEIHGPMGFCDMDQEGMLIEGFEYRNMFVTINNAPYYKDHMEKMGYTKAIDWVETRIDVPTEMPRVLERIAERVLEDNELQIVRAKNRKEVKKLVPEVFEVVTDTYKNLYGEVDMTDAQIQRYVDQFILLLNTKYLTMVRNKEGEMIGIGLSMPSLADASKKSRGRLFPFGWFRILTAPYRSKETLELYLVGVKDKYKNAGVPAVLMVETLKAAIKDGFKYAETGPNMEDNMAIRSLWKRFNGIQHKRRRCWIKKIDE